MFERVKKVVSHLFGGPDTTQRTEPRVIGKAVHGIDPSLVSSAALRTCQALQTRGYTAYIVGGAVRDLLLGVRPKDFDVATDAEPEKVKRCQRRAIIIGKRFRLVHVLFGSETIECSTFRALDAKGVRKDASGRVINDNVFGEMWEDAARRDFTINALYYDPTTELIYDYHNGFRDIQNRTLRMIGIPSDRYREDPVRMMRAVRIATKLDFKIESATEKAIPQMAKLLDNVPAARLFDEVIKLLTCGKAEACLLKLRQAQLHRTLLPMLDIIFKEPEGEEFLLLALRRTDERIAAGKKISPAFLFATLLWPQVKKRWDAYQTRPEMHRTAALYAAAQDVVATQCAKLAIQACFVNDMVLIWMLQIRFERFTGKNPYTLTAHPKYRAGYDFMLLRSLLGHVPAETVRWWEDFVEADEDQRADMIATKESLARNTAQLARNGRKKKLVDKTDAQVFSAVENAAQTAHPRRDGRNGHSRPAHSDNFSDSTTPQQDANTERFGDFHGRFESNVDDAQSADALSQPSLLDPSDTPANALSETRKRRPRRRSRTKHAALETNSNGETSSTNSSEAPVIQFEQVETQKTSAKSQPQSSDNEKAPRRAPTRRKRASQSVDSQPENDTKTSTPVATESVDEAPRPKRTRRPRKPKETPAEN